MRNATNLQLDPAAIVSRDPGRASGAVVFAGTRVPVQVLLDHVAYGLTADEFLEGHPTVERWQAEGFLELAAQGALGAYGMERIARGRWWRHP